MPNDRDKNQIPIWPFVNPDTRIVNEDAMIFQNVKKTLSRQSKVRYIGGIHYTLRNAKRPRCDSMTIKTLLQLLDNNYVTINRYRVYHRLALVLTSTPYPECVELYGL